MSHVGLEATASYLPETVIDNSFFSDGEKSSHPMFKGARERRHVSAEDTSVNMIEKAVTKLADQTGRDLSKDVDILLTNVTCLDIPFTGSGASVAHKLGLKPKWILDVHNTGCVSFIYMMEIAQKLMADGEAKTALICNVQNAAGRVFNHPDNRKRPQSAIPGDGCGVGLLVKDGKNPIKSIISKNFGAYADDMQVTNEKGENWWDPREQSLYIDFSEDRIGSIVARGNRLVPEVMYDALKQAGIKSEDVDTMITNQPNPIFLRNWREALLLPKEKQVESYEEHGNLFGAAIPINIERAMNDEARSPEGGYLALGGFSHAGDYAAAAVVQFDQN
ncbi:MAG: 3-oxoacyl-ACP synthase [Deltaproteobacteria bacterium]|jgi:3-oxoacyl-[acyl-carrier-protein] synthase III|nr:3-oxoacyl-ACP synthase [Deltaproteobacteria bacterium]MBT6434441.1 3-oxoacyl-ACP synthase [Deltaproteobacteria bacterium]MBT6489628.1 3-oxoacyl-ACP synthase [Deltaproteobacteria bacterium]